jgi:hypothetical protein
MRSGALAAVAATLLTLLLAPGAGASHDPSGAPFGEDFVVGSFTTTPPTFIIEFTIDAHSGPSGENPTGDVRVDTGDGAAAGRVSCLNVTGSRATIGVDFADPSIGGGFFFVEDNDGAGQDAFSAAPTGEPPSVCPADPSTPPAPISDGDITVHDAPARPTSKEQCTNGGWRNFGPAFENQGECVAFVRRGPKA